MNLSMFALPEADTPRYIGCNFRVSEIQDRIIYLTAPYNDEISTRLFDTTGNTAITLIDKEFGRPDVYYDDEAQGPYQILSVQHLGVTDSDTLAGKFRITKVKLLRKF